MQKKLQDRGAPRFRFKDERRTYIRFTSSAHRDIHTTRIFDISSTGLSFTCSKRLAPRIGAILKMEFSPSGGIQMAVLGKVKRIEEPGDKVEWARFPGTVKIGVQFHDLPKQYVKLITKTIEENVLDHQMEKTQAQAPVQIRPTGQIRVPTWFEENIWTILIGFVILLSAAAMFYVILDSADYNRKQTVAPWASNFFDKVIKKPGQ